MVYDSGSGSVVCSNVAVDKRRGNMNDDVTLTFTRVELDAIRHSIQTNEQECDGNKADFWFGEPHISVLDKIKAVTA